MNDIFIQIPDLCTLQKWIKKARTETDTV